LSVSLGLYCLLIPLLLLLIIRTARLLRINPRGTVLFGLLLTLARWYVRIMHRLRVSGLEHVPDGVPPEGILVIPNHTAGVDAVLVQAVLPFEVRWIMAGDMAIAPLRRLWTYLHIITVERNGRDLRGLREAMRHLADQGAVGLFAEGHIERPPRHLHAFQPGVGLIIAKSGATVLPIVIEGTPQVDPPWASLFRLSRSTIRILPPIEAAELRTGNASAKQIAERLERRFAEATGWPAAPWLRERSCGRRLPLWRAIVGLRAEEPTSPERGTMQTP
jgi:1-acyl-sn-glycerol-3-phosphate acyltransferase